MDGHVQRMQIEFHKIKFRKVEVDKGNQIQFRVFWKSKG